MKNIEQIQMIRRMYAEDVPISRIASTMHISRPTVYRYIKMGDFNDLAKESAKDPTENAEKGKSPPEEDHSILAGYKELIIGWLEADRHEILKQRHTNYRIYTRLRDEAGFQGSRATVDNYVRQLRKEMGVFKKKSDTEGYLPLEHPPGTAQVDFGKARYIENGISHFGSFCGIDFPYSNQAYIQLKPGENLECLLESLQAIFFHLGGVPREIWFDNASCITGFDSNGMRSYVSERFILFSMHYGFTYFFMNRGKGNEKGAVEKSIGTYRNNILVPVPDFESLDDYNKGLPKKCEDFIGKKNHYKKGIPIRQLAEEDRAALLPLPRSPFDTAQNRKVHTDKCGIFTLQDGLHRYSSSPGFCEEDLNIRVTSTVVEVMDDKRRLIVTHPRMYGGKGEHMERIDYIPYLEFMARKPNSFRNMPVREMMPDFLCTYMDGLSNTDRGKALEALWKLIQKGKSFRDAVDTMAASLQNGHFEELVPGPGSPGRDTGESRKKEAEKEGSSEPEFPLLSPDDESLKQRLEKFDFLLKGER